MSAGPSPAHDEGVRRYVRWALRNGGWLWVAAALVGTLGLVGTIGLYARLKSDLEALLPRKAPSVAAIEELRARLPGLQNLGVLVDTGGPHNVPAAERFLDDLAARIRAHGGGVVRAVRLGMAEERAFLERNAPLYVELADLQTIRERLAERKSWEARKSFGMLLDETETAPPLDLSDLRGKYEARARVAGGGQGKAAPGGRFSSAELGVSLLLVQLERYSTGAESARAIVERVKADIAALGGPDAYAPGMRVRFTGEVAIAIEEMSALEADLTASSILVVLAVALVLLLYFRWWPAVPVLLAPLGVATVGTFGLVQLPPLAIRELNSNTAFLGSIVIGNGINFAIILLARYLEARRAGVGVEEALVVGVLGSRTGTLIAATAAGVSYASLLATDFRGFRQFGLIGGLGMLMCWGAAFLLMPSLVARIDRGRWAVKPKSAKGARAVMAPLARFVMKHAVPLAVAGAVVTGASIYALKGLSVTRLESDFSQLRRRDTWTDGEGFWGRKMDALLGRYLSPTVILADSLPQAEAIARRIEEARKRPPLSTMVADVRTVDDLLPRDQEAKLAEVEKVRRLLSPAVRAELAPEQLAQIDRWLGGEALRPITEADLPSSFRDLLHENDGQLTRAVLIYPALSRGLWKADNIFAYVDALRALASAGGDDQPGATSEAVRPGRVAGALPLSADIIRSIAHDGPLASVVALSGVVVIVVLMFRGRRESALVIGALLVGVLWMTALTIAFGVKINFSNFIAFPITFGIGVDYAVNVISRYVADGRRDLAGAIESTGGAVGVCSVTTIIGYSSLLLAKNQALFLFGLVAVLGEVTCLIAAVIALPAVLRGFRLWQTGRRSGRRVGVAGDDAARL